MRPRFASCAALILLATGPAAAKNISITLAPTVEVSGGTFTLRVKIGNQGDEAAQSVTPTLHFQEQETRAQTRPSLAPNESFEESLSIPVRDVKPGRWPFRLTVDYTDANQYAFQTMHVNTVLIGRAPPPKMSVSQVAAGSESFWRRLLSRFGLDLALDPLATTGMVRVRLKNLAAVARTATVSVLVPEGLEVPEALPPVPFAAWQEKTVSAQLVNRTTLPGSKYLIYVTVEYDEDGSHQTVIASGLVEIVAAQSLFQRYQTIIWIGAGALAVIWVTMILWRVSARVRVRPASDR